MIKAGRDHRSHSVSAPAVLLGLGCLVFWGSSCATVSVRPPEPRAASGVIDKAHALKGSPYRYGGSTPEGFDCSGFVQYVYRAGAGVRLPRSSKAQYSRGRPVPRGQEQPSDLLFFNVDGRGVSHVGIYLGKGRFIHAPRNGGAVKVSDANEPYWRQRFISIRRVL